MGARLPGPMEALEPRLALNADLPLVLYYPEGFAGDSINAFIPISNLGSEPARWELSARYEFGARDQVLASGTLPGLTRGGVTLSDAARGGAVSAAPGFEPVREGVPYALILRSDRPLAATLSHYDFNTAIGESFTRTVAAAWTFGFGAKREATTRDFLLFFNPSDADAGVTIRFFGPFGLAATHELTVGPQRRGGVSVRDLAAVPEGLEYGVTVESTVPIVAAQSHYRLDRGGGFGALGAPGVGGPGGEGGGTRGVVMAASARDAFALESEADAWWTILGTLASRADGWGRAAAEFGDRFVASRGSTHQAEFGRPRDAFAAGFSGLIPPLTVRYDDGLSEVRDSIAQRRAAIAGFESRWWGVRDAYIANPARFAGFVPEVIALDADFNDLTEQHRRWMALVERQLPRYDADIAANAGSAVVGVLNAGPTPASVTLTFLAADDAARSLALTAPARARVTVDLRPLELPAGDWSAAYVASTPVTLTASVLEGAGAAADGAGSTALTAFSTGWSFGEGYMSRERAGAAVTADLFLFNPGPGPVDVLIRLVFTDGTTLERTSRVEGAGAGPGRAGVVKLHDWPALRDRAADSFFGIRVEAPTPIAALLEHWDAGNGGGFAAPGLPD